MGGRSFCATSTRYNRREDYGSRVSYEEWWECDPYHIQASSQATIVVVDCSCRTTICTGLTSVTQGLGQVRHSYGLVLMGSYVAGREQRSWHVS